MRGDFTRRTFDRTKHYNGVLMQQGRVQLDADWNEQQAIDEYRTQTDSRDVIGPTGAPKVDNGGGFAIGLATGGADLSISAGRMYVDGILCENEASGTSLLQQADLPMASGNLAGYSLPTATGIFVVYLDVWQRLLTSLDDPDMREPGLNGPDTTTRARTVWQVKLTRVGDLGASITCATLGNTWKPPAKGDGQMRARTAVPTSTAGPCVLPPTAGFRRLENQLYRVEIHADGSRATARFKWSRENGSVVTSITQLGTQKVTVHDLGRDDVLGFASDDWAEMLDDRFELVNQRGALVQLGAIAPTTREITIKSGTLAPLDLARHAKLRRWDQSGSGLTTDGVPLGTDWVPLEDGVEVQFSSAGTFRAGDYWLIPARTAIGAENGDVLWPTNSTTGERVMVDPHGIEHHYAALALVSFNGSTFTMVPNGDCRPIFPPLTAITAGDVSFDNTLCSLPNANNVQHAIEALCQMHDSACTLTVSPKSGWEAVFNQIPTDKNVQICFQVGEYPLANSVHVAGGTAASRLGSLTLVGCGAGTRIVAATRNAALLFDNWQRVSVRDLSVTAGPVAVATGSLDGALTFNDCDDVVLERVLARCGAGSARTASCVTVRNTPSVGGVRPHGSVRMRDCELQVGNRQIGLLITDANRVHIEGNLVQTYMRQPHEPNLAQLVTDVVDRKRLRRRLIFRPSLATDHPPTVGNWATVILGAARCHFQTELLPATAWQLLVNADPSRPASVPNAAALLKYVEGLADRILVAHGSAPGSTAAATWYAQVQARHDSVDVFRPSGAQGIVVGGQTNVDLRILNNTIESFVQGIHVGTSRRTTSRVDPTAAVERTYIADNTIRTVCTTTSVDERHGIFVGNSRSVTIEHNYMSALVTVSRLGVDGIRVFGFLGRFIMVRENHLDAYATGVKITPVLTVPSSPQWLVGDNLTEHSPKSIDAPASVRNVFTHS